MPSLIDADVSFASHVLLVWKLFRQFRIAIMSTETIFVIPLGRLLLFANFFFIHFDYIINKGIFEVQIDFYDYR